MSWRSPRCLPYYYINECPFLSLTYRSVIANGRQTFSSSLYSPISVAMLSGLIFLSLLHLSIACSSDNCLRALKRYNAADFCSTYTSAINTATTSLPAYATACSNSPSRISSACSCIATAPVTTCVASPLKDPSFLSGSADWAVSVNQNPTQTVAPEYSFGPYGLHGGCLFVNASTSLLT